MSRPALAWELVQSNDVGVLSTHSLKCPGSPFGSLMPYALDGQGRNSPFTAALAKGLREPGRNLTSVMIDVRKDVLAVTGGKQVPWDHSALTGDFYFQLASAPGTLPKTEFKAKRVRDLRRKP